MKDAYDRCMNLASALRQLRRDTTTLDASQIDLGRALRNTIGVLLPLVVGAVSGHLLTGFGMSIGALNVAFSDSPDPYRLRAARMVGASAFGALSVFAGAATSSFEPLAIIVVAIWAFGGGMALALGMAAGQVGVTGIILLLVYSGYPTSLGNALNEALLVGAGGLLQALLAVSAWPTNRHRPERKALSDLFAHLATQADDPANPDASPPMTGQITSAALVLTGVGRDHSATGEAFRALLDEAERMRLELVALNAIPIDSIPAEVKDFRACVGRVLRAISAISIGREPDVDVDRLLHGLDETADLLHTRAQEVAPSQRLLYRRVLAHTDALAGQVRASVDLVRKGDEGSRGRRAFGDISLRETARGALDILRANATLQSTNFRHALRLAACLTLASFVGRRLGLTRVYWVPLTAAIVLRPDFSTTFTRGIGRIAGTMIGLGLATLLVFTPFWNLPGRILLVGLLTFIVRSVGPANFSLSAVVLSALVVVLLAFAGSPPDTTISVRALDTLLGGTLALAMYVLWPTWERTQTPIIVANMLRAYRNYFDAVMHGYQAPARVDRERLSSTRQAARLARSNAETSIQRLRAEPVASGDAADFLDGLLATSHRFAQSVMALETGLYRDVPPTTPDTDRFRKDVDQTVEAIEESVRRPSQPLSDIPDLRSDHNALVGGGMSKLADDDRYRVGTLIAETERITNSLNTMVHLVGRRDTQQEHDAR